MFAHLIFRADISPGADCASKQQRGCKWEWVGGGYKGVGGRGCLEKHKHRFIYSP